MLFLGRTDKPCDHLGFSTHFHRNFAYTVIVELLGCGNPYHDLCLTGLSAESVQLKRPVLDPEPLKAVLRN